MHTQELNNNLISAIREKLPAGANMANVLMDILFIGREAIYRRLRGEVPFTLSEAAIIGRKLDLSLDSLVVGRKKGIAVVNLHYSRNHEALSAYRSMLEDQISVYSQLAEDKGSQLHLACNLITFMTAFNYDHVARFILFKWLYQREALPPGMLFRDFTVPGDIAEMHKMYIKQSWSINYGSCLWDHMMFDYLYNDLRYFANIGLLKPEDLDILKKDVLKLIDDSDDIAMKGKLENGREIQLYISNVNFDATYGYGMGKDVRLSLVKVCGASLITSSDLNMFELMKEWVESLRKFSTLISQSGEMQRITFFNKQRANLKLL